MGTEAQQEDTEELVIVETPPEEEGGEAQAGTDDDDDDKRLAAEAGDEDEGDDDPERAAKRQKRRRYRELRKQAEARTKDENRELREIVSVMSARLNTLEGSLAHTGEQNIDQRLSHATTLLGQIDAAIAKAVEEGDGTTVAAAMRDRDIAIDHKRALEAAKQQTTQARGQPQVDPQITTYARGFARENSDWFDPAYGNEESRRARAIDTALAAEGWDPRTPAYWSELQKRCDKLFDVEEEPKPRRTPPPTGRTREHSTPSTRGNEVYVSPERKAALIENGDWDDPVKRNVALKYYRDWDREQREAAR